MLAKIRRNFSTIYEFIFFIYILLFTLAVSFLVKVVKIQTVLTRLASLKKSLWEGKVTPERLCEYVDKVLTLRIFGLKPNCLNRSVVLYHFLHKLGVSVNINFGVRKVEGDIEGHGWLTMNGKPYMEKSDSYQAFSLIYSYPGTHRALGPQIGLDGVV